MDISGLTRGKPAKPKRNLLLLRERIKRGNTQIAFIYPQPKQASEATLRFSPAHKTIIHRKAHSDFSFQPATPGCTIRTTALLRGQKVITKSYLVPSKPVLIPFAERPVTSTRLSVLRSCPYSRSSLVTSPAETLGNRPVTSVQGVSAGGLLDALKRSLSWSYLNGS